MGWVADQPATIELNEAQSSAVIHYPAERLIVNGAYKEATTFGPMSATFSPETISIPFSWGKGVGNEMNLAINRLTGAALISSKEGISDRWTCQVGRKQF